MMEKVALLRKVLVSGRDEQLETEKNPQRGAP